MFLLHRVNPEDVSEIKHLSVSTKYYFIRGLVCHP